MGGVGIDALLETKGLLQRNCLESGAVKYLAIDADMHSLTRRSSPDTGSVGLAGEMGEWVLLNPPAAQSRWPQKVCGLSASKDIEW